MKDFMNILAVQGNIFRIDSRLSTRAMSTFALTADEVGNLFDSIAYDKCEKIATIRKLFKIIFFTAASVIRTFEHAIGENIFKEAINLYLNNK